MSVRAAMVSLVLLSTILIAGAATAEEQSPVPFVLGGKEVFYIRASAAGYSPKQRWEILQRRIVQILKAPNAVSQPVEVAKKGRDATITIGGKLLITATLHDARVNKTTVSKLADTWAKKVREVLPLADPTPPPAATKK